MKDMDSSSRNVVCGMGHMRVNVQLSCMCTYIMQCDIYKGRCTWNIHGMYSSVDSAYDNGPSAQFKLVCCETKNVNTLKLIPAKSATANNSIVAELTVLLVQMLAF